MALGGRGAHPLAEQLLGDGLIVLAEEGWWAGLGPGMLPQGAFSRNPQALALLIGALWYRMLGHTTCVMVFVAAAVAGTLMAGRVHVVAMLAAGELLWVCVLGTAVCGMGAASGPAFLVLAITAMVVSAAELAVALALFFSMANAAPVTSTAD